jgi:hypothetical protein
MNLASLAGRVAVAASGSLTEQLSSATAWIGYIVFATLFYILLAIALWRVFTKAGYPGILSLIPIVNAVILVRIGGLNGWLTLLYLVPIVNVVFAIVVAVKVGAAFGKDPVWSVFLLWLLSIIGYFILGYGDAKYTKPASA